MSHAAQLSIVVVATNLLQVTACVESLRGCAALEQAEIVLVSRLDCSSLEAIYPRMRIVAAQAGWSIPRMRAEGLRGVSGSWAAVIAEDYRAGDDWAQVALAGQEQADVLVGEVIAPDRGLFARAAYLWEYLHVAPPAAPGQLTREQARWAPAGAVVYRLQGLDIERIAAARSEMDYHAVLFDAGRRFRRDPQMQLRFGPAVPEFLSDRMRRSREWARSRSAPLSLPSRWLLGLSCAVLPIVLVGRFTVRAAARPGYWLGALAAFPFVLLFAGAETWGQMQGYLRRTV